MDEDRKFAIFLAALLAVCLGGMVAAIVIATQPSCLEERWDGKDWQCTRMSDEPRADLDCTRRFRTESGKWECASREPKVAP